MVWRARSHAAGSAPAARAPLLLLLRLPGPPQVVVVPLLRDNSEAPWQLWEE